MNSASAPILPPTRTENDENFPVVFHLLPKDKRHHVMAYYRFARTADDIADSAELPTEKKLTLLDLMEKILVDPAPNSDPASVTTMLRDSFNTTAIPPSCATDLLIAFRWDTLNRRYESWEALCNYCRHSAEPVGRYLLMLHGENLEATLSASNALSTALQIINHVQDCRKDLHDLGRLYMPENWMAELGIAPEDLLTTPATGSIRVLFDRVLDGIDQLLDRAAALPRAIKHRGLKAQASVTLSCALVLRDRLRVGDPLTTRIDLSKGDKTRLALIGGIRGVFRL